MEGLDEKARYVSFSDESGKSGAWRARYRSFLELQWFQNIHARFSEFLDEWNTVKLANTAASHALSNEFINAIVLSAISAYDEDSAGAIKKFAHENYVDALFAPANVLLLVPVFLLLRFMLLILEDSIVLALSQCGAQARYQHFLPEDSPTSLRLQLVPSFPILDRYFFNSNMEQLGINVSPRFAWILFFAFTLMQLAGATAGFSDHDTAEWLRVYENPVFDIFVPVAVAGVVERLLTACVGRDSHACAEHAPRYMSLQERGVELMPINPCDLNTKNESVNHLMSPFREGGLMYRLWQCLPTFRKDEEASQEALPDFNDFDEFNNNEGDADETPSFFGRLFSWCCPSCSGEKGADVSQMTVFDGKPDTREKGADVSQMTVFDGKSDTSGDLNSTISYY